MLSREEFYAGRHKFRVLALRVGLATGGLALIASLGVPGGSALAIGIMLGWAALLGLWTKWLAQRLGLRCPRCGSRAVGHRGQMLLDTDRCRNCRTVVFSARHEPPAGESALPTTQEFAVRAVAELDHGDVDGLIVHLVVITSIVIGVLPAFAPGVLPAWVTGERVLLAAVAVIALTVVALERRRQARLRRLGLCCPGCQQPLVGGHEHLLTQLTMQTLLCDACGIRVLRRDA